MTERLAIGVLGFADLGRLVEVGRRAESAGFESLWLAETRITRDAVTGMTAVLTSTDRIRVGSAAVNVFTRGAGLTAVTWATLAEAAPGRVVLGIGPGSRDPLRQQGFAFDRPLARLSECVGAIRGAWTQPPPVSYEGDFVRFDALTPELVPDVPPPIYLCVTGPRALDLAGRVSDGVVLNAFMPPEYVEGARGIIDRAAGGRFEGEVAGALVVTMADSAADAVAQVRPILATYLVHFPDLAAHTGLDPDFLESLRKVSEHEGMDAVFGLLPDDLVARHALCGTPAECRARLEDFTAAGLELPVLFPDPGSVDRVIAELAPD